MKYYLNPKVLVADLLREFVTDPRDRGEPRTEEIELGATEYALSPTSGNVLTITNVTVGSTELKKWQDYFWDYQNQKIILTEEATDTVSITYLQGTEWIYPEKPAVKLTETDFPRVDLIMNGGASNRLGQYNAPMEDTYAIQVDLWVKDDFIYTINGMNYEGNMLADYLGSQIKNALSRNSEGLYPYAYTLEMPTGLRDLPYDEEYQCHHKILILEINSINENEVEI